MDVALYLIREGSPPRRFALSGDVTTIGRAEGCDLRVPLGEISRKHCTIVVSDNALVIQDLGSSNGTFVNSRRVQQARLSAGDSLRLGSLLFVVQLDGEPPEHQLQEVSEKTTGGTTGGDTKPPEEPDVDEELIDALEDDDDFP
jgi:pSer/pThr/pTyr-binding forkhead associated (FHA) protein